MNLLIDTHVLIWWVKDARRIRGRVLDQLRRDETRVLVSAVSAWEITTKVRIGKLTFDTHFLDDFKGWVRALAFESLDITPAHAVAGARLPGPHRDPFDRMLAGQAQIENLTLVSADPAFKLLGIETLW